MRFKTVIFATLTAIFCACNNATNSSLDSFRAEKFVPEFATGFRIAKTAPQTDNQTCNNTDTPKSSLITITNPWQGADFEQQIFVARNNEKPPKGFCGEVIKAPIRSVVCLSSGYVAMFDALGHIEKVKGVSGKNFITNPHIHNPKSGVADVGYDANLDFERIVALRPDVVMMFGVAGENSLISAKLRELGIPYMYIGDYVEQSPLGKAEWIYVVAELTESHERADSLFGMVKSNYQKLAEQVAQKATSRPRVMLNTPYRDVWFLPPMGSYMVRMITDAGGEVFTAAGEGNTSQAIDSEQAYIMVSQSEVWLNVGGCTSLAELTAQNPRFKTMPVVRNGKVYNNNRRRTQAGGSDFWESGIVRPDLILQDLISILHPEIGDPSELKYYEPLN